MNNKTLMEYYNKYIINIFERYTDLKKSKKDDFDNNDLWKIFEYYSCIKLSEEYIIKNKRPSSNDNDIVVKQMGNWIGSQQTNYSKNNNIVKDEVIKKLWFDFTTNYKQYFLSNNELWFNSLKEVEDYIIKNNKKPSTCDKDIEIKRLGI